jgi:pectinesterase
MSEGWANWNNTDSYKTARYSEFKNYGPGADLRNRVSWAKQLSEAEASELTPKNVFGDWNPRKEINRLLQL